MYAATIGMDGEIKSISENSNMEQPQKTVRDDLVKQRSLTMEYFLESRNLDMATEKMLVEYDKDRNGTFSKDEVAAIVIDLHEAHKSNEALDESNRMFKQLLSAALVFAAFLLASMFGLSYAVAALTANTEVQSDGTLMSKGANPTAIATDSRANLHDLYLGDGDDGETPYCVSAAEVNAIKNEVLSGKNVLIQMNEFEGGSTKIEQLLASGAEFNETDGSLCFHVPEQEAPTCFIPTTNNCITLGADGRRLGSNDKYYNARELQDCIGEDDDDTFLDNGERPPRCDEANFNLNPGG